MGKKVHYCTITSIKEIAPGIFDTWVECEEIAKKARLGQFLHIKCGNSMNELLRRPISICDTQDNKVRFIFEIKGEGTKDLSRKKTGDVVDILGPLGNGFIVEGENPILIGGGIGIFPLLMLAKQLKNPKIFLGFRNKERVVLEDEFKEIGETYICTDDGSYGQCGLITDLVKAYGKNPGIIYACGPIPMLKAVSKLAEELNIKAQISMEQRMGCGIGACLVCTCKAGGHYEKVCQKGPVFYSSEVDFDE